MSFEPIAIVGRACLLPGAHTPKELWRVVTEKRIALRPIPDGHWRADRYRMLSSSACATDVGGVVEGFDNIWNPAGFAIDADSLVDLDPVIYWLLHTGREALRDAGITHASAHRIGVIAGNLAYPTEALVDFAQSVYLPEALTTKRAPLNRFSSGFPVHLMCRALELSAGGYAIDAACASSLYAIKLASDWLHGGRADIMLAGAVNRCDGLIIHSGFTALHALSPTGQSRPFHREADGLVPSEGAALVVLKRLADAIGAGDRILGVIRGIGLSNDGRSSGILTPSSEGQIRAMKAAYAQSGLDPADISFVECHATGTTVGDATELRSMASVFAGARDVPIGSLKSNIGHSITASGAAGLIRVIEAMQAGIRPAIAASGPFTDALDGTPFRVLREHELWQAQGTLRAAVSSFGFGGNNAHLVVEQYRSGIRCAAPPAAVPRKQVAVVALAAQAGDGQGTQDFISDLLIGRRPVATRAKEIRVPASGLAFPPRDLGRALAQQTALLGVTAEALSQVTLSSPERTAVFVGMQCDAEATRPVIRLSLADLSPPGVDLASAETAMDEPMDAARVVGCMPNMSANRLNRQFSIGGPGFSVAAEELSGLRALEIAIDQLGSGQIDAAIVGASDFCSEPVHAAATSEHPGDAACVLVVKRIDDAQRDGDRILAIVEESEIATYDGIELAAKVRDRFGGAHAAQGLLDVAAAVAAIDRSVLPGGVPFLPREDRRRIAIRTDATGWQSVAVQVIEPQRLPASWPPGLVAGEVPDLFLYSGRDLYELKKTLHRGAELERGDCRLAIVATPSELAGRIDQAFQFLNQDPHRNTPPDGIIFQPSTIKGDLAYVFTGAAAAYPGMGRDLLLAFPELAEMFRDQCRVDVQHYAGWVYRDDVSPSDFDQLCGSTLLCQAHAWFTRHILALAPQAAIGLSSGETNALFALGAWNRMGEFLRAIEACGLYTRVLGGSGEALGGSSWTHYRILASEREVHDALGGESSVFVAIINAPDDVLIGGESSACERVARRFGTRAMPVPLQLAVHCPAVRPAAALWHKLHFRPTAQPPGVRFYSNASGTSYELTADSGADSLTEQALTTVDFPKTIRKAWDDGVRIFVEHGPRNQCTQSIRLILAGRPHLAIPLDVNGRSSLRQALAAAAELWCAGTLFDIAGLRLRLQSLHVRNATTTDPGAFLALPAHPPAPLCTFSKVLRDDDVFVMAPAPELAPLLEFAAIPQFGSPLQRALVAMHAKMSETHRLHIAELGRLHSSFLAAEQHLLRLLSPLDAPAHGNGIPLAKHQPPQPRRSFSRADLENLAVGRISDVFGKAFCGQDGFARQVRMPQPPLLLADRVVDLTGEPNSMGLGSIVTETDIRSDSWYLHQGYMPAGIAVECGQADLLLISWLGVDQFNKGERVYRLLGCELTFHGSPPKIGDTLRYEIQVDGHTAHGDVRMFSFHYDCFAGTEKTLTVRNGQAGFFTDRELADSEGVLWAAESSGATPEAAVRLDPPTVLTARRAFDVSQVRAFSEGRMAECFGEAFARAYSHTRSPCIQTGRMLLIRTIEEFDPKGGPWGRGYLRAEYPISADDWFFEGHFKNDPCMPGTLMFEGCLQAMAFYLSALGFALERDGWRFEPVSEQPYLLRCRGQVLPSSAVLTYEVFVDEINGGPEPVLFADVLCRLDGLKIFHCRRLGLRLVPSWPLEEVSSESSADVPFDYQSLIACALGRPSQAFGPDFAKFDGSLKVPRLPGPPYHFISRVTQASQGNPVAGAAAEVEYDVPADAWYFAENGSPVMPVCVLVEVLLQPCGWLASYAGTWLDSKQDIFFRNLDGSGIFHAEVSPRSRVLRTSVTLTSCSPVGAMSITAFRMVCRADDQLVFEGTAVFGHFPADALRNQPGLSPAPGELEWMAAAPDANISINELARAVNIRARLGRGKLQMIDRIACFWPEGGRAHLGVMRAEKDIDPKDWFFKAHFFTDPVQPGSLGLEAAIETLQAYLLLSRRAAAMRNPRFEPVGIGLPVTWTYRGQVLPHNRLVTILLEVLDVTENQACISARAAASLWVDGTKIYSIPDFGMRLLDDAPARDPDADSTELLDPAIDTWLQDHCPTYTIPVLPMMSVLDRLGAAAARSTPGRHPIEIRDAQLNGWIAFERGARRLKTEAVSNGEALFDVTLSVWRDAPHAEMSRYDVMATARVRLGDRYPDPPPPLPKLIEADLAHDPPTLDVYESGELFHGAGFHFLKRMWRSGEGSSFLLDAGAAAVPPGFLDQALFDGIAHGIPNENLRLWSSSIPAEQVGYPSRIIRLSLFSECPADRKSECEVRFDGFDQGQLRFPKFIAQLIRDGRVWAEMELVYALFNKGPLGIVPGRQRRRFLRDRIFVPGMLLGDHTAALTRISTADLSSTDWLPGTVDFAFGIREADRLASLAVRQHVSQKAEVHPTTVTIAEDFHSARCPRLPVTIFPLRIERDENAVTVRDDGEPRVDCEAVRKVWRRLSGIDEWPVADLHIGLIERFVRRVEIDDVPAFARLHGQPVLYLANHQVAIESILFNVLLGALSEVPIKIIAKDEHRQSWIGQLVGLAARYPNARQPDPILFFDRSDPGSFFTVLDSFRSALRDRTFSLMAHVDGTRATSSRARTTQASAILLDLALDLNLTIVPVRFLGGLPVDPVPMRLDLPFQCGQQDIRIGCPIAADALRELPLAERSRVVISAINALAPENETALPPHPNWRRAGARVLLESLRLASKLCDESRMVLAAANGDPRFETITQPAEASWIREFAGLLRNTLFTNEVSACRDEETDTR